MANPTTYASAKQAVGIAKETTQGTAVAPTFTVPVEKFEPEDQITWLDDKALRGSMVENYARIQGVKKVEFSMSGPWYPDAFGYLLNNILGDLTTTGSSAPYSHAMSLYNTGASQPGSLTFSHYEGPTATYATRTFAGCCLSELTIKGNAESSLITMDAKGTGWQSAAALATFTPSPSTEAALAAWRFQLALTGTLPSAAVKTCSEFEIGIKRNLEVKYTGQNLDVPYFIQRGTVEVNGKLKFVAADETPLTYYLNNTQPQLQLMFTNGVTPSSDAAYRALTVDIQKAAYKSTKIDTGSATVGWETEFDAIANTINAGASGGYSPAKFTLVNAVTSGTY